MKLYDAARCPYCARVRLALAEKAVSFETVAIDLQDRPAWIYDLNPTGRVPVLDDGFVLAESAVIMEYLEERFPEPPLLPADPAGRARARLMLLRFDALLGDDYYAYRRGDPNELGRKLDELPVGESLFVDIAYLPWVMRLRELYGAALPGRLEAWLEELLERPAGAAELQIVRGLA
ncbi:MAG TPA: glutathione S-transferase family protein [Gaiellaceae bacterium]